MNPFHAIFYGSFLEYLDPQQHYTIYSDISLENRASPEHITLLPLEDLISGEKEKNTSSHIICITMKLTHQDILSIDRYDRRPKLWLSLHPGIMSIIYKYTTEDDDITHMLSKGYPVWEPYDQHSFIHLLQQPQGYGRIIDTFLPESIHQKKKSDNNYTLLNNDGHYHDLIIMAGGSSIASISQSIPHSEKGESNITIIAQGGWTKTIDVVEVISHIHHASRLLIIVEHAATESLRMYYDVLLKQYNPTLQISYLFPQYNLMNSILPEYSYELAGFDSKGIGDYLQHRVS